MRLLNTPQVRSPDEPVKNHEDLQAAEKRLHMGGSNNRQESNVFTVGNHVQAITVWDFLIPKLWFLLNPNKIQILVLKVQWCHASVA